MHRMSAPLASLVALLVLLGGCAAQKPAPGVDSAAAPGSGAPAPAGAIAPVVGPLQEVDVAGHFVSDGGIMPPQAVACFDPSTPQTPRAGGCEDYLFMFLNVTGRLTGRVMDIFHLHFEANNTMAVSAKRVFTGSVQGCGSGTFTMLADGWAPFEANAAKRGYFHVVEPFQSLLAGSPTTGLAGMTAAHIQFEFNTTFGPSGAASIPDGTVRGKVWCRSTGDAASLSRHEGADATPVLGRFTMDSVETESQLSCDTQSRQCETLPDLLVDLTGTLHGQIVDHGHFHHHGSADTRIDAYGERIFTGTVEGCGSGTMTMLVQGTTSADPNPPNVFHMREPPMRLVAGSTTTGLSRLVDGEITLEWNLTVAGTIRDGVATGTLWCKDGPPDQAGAGKPAATSPVSFKTTTDGALLLQEQTCGADPSKPDECDVYATQYLIAPAPWNALIQDAAHLHTHGNGSVSATAERLFFGTVPGCGSGVMMLHLSGFIESPTPILGRPGYFHLKEPTMRLVPGSTTIGLANLVDFAATGDLVFTGEAAGEDTFTGRYSCR